MSLIVFRSQKTIVHVSFITIDDLPLCLGTLQSIWDSALAVCTRMFSLLFRTKRANIVYRVEDPSFLFLLVQSVSLAGRIVVSGLTAIYHSFH